METILRTSFDGCLSDRQHICNCIENGLHAGNEGKKKTDKKQLCIEIFTKIFNLNEAEKLLLDDTIQFIYDNDLITKFSKINKYTLIMVNFIKSKL